MGAKASKAKASNDAYCTVPVLDVQEQVCNCSTKKSLCKNQLDLSEEIESSMDYGGDVNQKDIIEAKVSILNMESRNSRDVRLDGCSLDEYEAELIYYEAKALKDKNQYQEAAKKFHFLIDMDQSHSKDSTTTMKFKSLKQMMKMKIKQGEYHQAAILFGHLLDFISSNCLWKSDYTISSVEKMLDRIFSLAPSHQADSDEKERLLAFTKIVYDEAINVFYPFKQRRECWSNENIWLHVYVKYSHFLFRLGEEQGLNELVQKLGYLREDATSVSITAYRLPSGLLVDFIELLLFRLQKDETLFIKSYQQKKIALGCMLSNYMCEMGSIHQYAAEIYLTSSVYGKAYRSLLCACRCWKLANDSLAHVHSVKLLYVVKMLHGSISIIGEDVLGNMSPSEAIPAIVKVFDAFQSDDIEVFEKYMYEANGGCVVIMQCMIEIHRKLQERILLKEIPETSIVQLSGLTSKMNGLALTTITSLVLNMIAEKKLRGQVINDEYFGSSVEIPKPRSCVADSVHALPLNGNIQIQPARNNTEPSTSYGNESQSNIQLNEDNRWPNPEEDFTIDIASSLAAGIANIIQGARTKYPHFARHIDITSLDFDELGKQLIRFLHQQVEFKAHEVSSFIDIGYHYTKPSCAASIRSTGLRCSKNGSFGPGVYTGNNWKAFTNRGSVGFITLRLQGKTTSIVFGEFGYIKSYGGESVNTVLGNKNKNGADDKKEVVLQSSSQCVPIIIFDAPRYNPFGDGCLDYIHKSLQRMIDSFLNTGPGVADPSTVLDESLNHFQASLTKTIPKQLLCIYNSPEHLADIDDKAIGSVPLCNYDYKHECPICLDELGSNPNVLRFLPCACVHIFHQDCIQKSLTASPRCPTCQSWVREPQGKSPSGTMRVTIIPNNCSGYLEDTIAIHYLIRGAFQKSYHPSPSTSHSGKNAIAYLPNNDGGKKLLKRLKYAFEHGLTFTVGKSMTTGRDNQCTWASIHHKTSLSGGTGRHGYPDVSYFLNCNEELDGLGVPPADDLPSDQVPENLFTKSIKNVLADGLGIITNKY